MCAHMFLGLRSSIHHTNDVAAARQWFESFLGFPPYFEAPRYVGFDVGGFELGIFYDPQNHGQANTYWGVPDAHEAVQSLCDSGCDIVEEITDVGEEILMASVRNPHGQIIGVIQNPHFTAREPDSPGPGK